MQVGMQVIADVTVILYEGTNILVGDKFFFEAVAVGCLVVSIGQIANGNTLGTIFFPYPV